MKKPLMIIVLLLAAVQIFQAQTADDILKKYFESVGGVDKWKNMKSLKMTGNLVMPQGEFPFTLYRKAPDKFKIVLNIMGQEIVPQAYDGETGWMINPFAGGSGPQKIPDEQIKAVKDESEFEDPFINYQAKGFEVSFEGTGDVAGVHCNILKLVKHKGVAGEEMSSTYYFDTDNALQIMVKQKSSQSMEQEIEIYLSDYQEAGEGLLMPFVIDTQMQGQSVQKLNFTAIKVNEEIADELFKMPETPAAPASPAAPAAPAAPAPTTN
jgi:outer membrane lipoprotein-sorting protein